MTTRLMRMRMQINNKKIVFPKANKIASVYPVAYPIAESTPSARNNRTIKIEMALPVYYVNN